MPAFVRIPLALALILTALQHLWSVTQAFLPLGGSEIVQLAILLLVGIGAHEVSRGSKR